MQRLILKFEGGTLAADDGVITIGRTPDNDVSFPEDNRVSRNHAEIETRFGESRLIDLGSSNGTSVNGEELDGDRYLYPGDVILLGGSAEISVTSEAVADAQAASGVSSFTADPGSSTVSAPPVGDAIRQAVSMTPPSSAVPASATSAAVGGSGPRTMLMVGGGALLVALLVAGAAAGVYYATRKAPCKAKVTLIRPDPNDTVSRPADVEASVDNAECVAKVVFSLDDEDFASASGEPFTATLDPAEFPQLADGMEHTLIAAVIDDTGQRLPQTHAIQLVLETREIKAPAEHLASSDVPAGSGPGGAATPAASAAGDISLIDVQKMSMQFVGHFSGGTQYNISNKEFLKAVRDKTQEFAKDGFFERAAKYRDVIDVAFIRLNNLDAPLGYNLAMARSGFEPGGGGSEAGIWRMREDFAKANAYDGTCDGQTIAEPTQGCAAKVAATYMKALIAGVFGGDTVYSVAAFGKSPAEAAAWKATLPADRRDVWNTIKTSPERDQVVRFFAAGIVAENPSKFGLKRDQPLSTLYH